VDFDLEESLESDDLARDLRRLNPDSSGERILKYQTHWGHSL
jgi:hypothetical protein